MSPWPPDNSSAIMLTAKPELFQGAEDRSALPESPKIISYKILFLTG